jgi:hypothetical protein
MRKAIILAAVLVAGAAGAFDASPLLQFITAQSWTPLTLGPVAWYKGDGNALDSGANGFNGTWVGAAAYTNGVNGQAFSFATSNYVSVANNAALSGFNAFSVALWVQSTSASVAAANEYIFGSYETTGNQRSWSVRRTATTGRLALIYSFDGTTAYDSNFDALPFDTAWHHVTLTRSGTNLIYYLDGVAKTTNTLALSSALKASSGAMTIGALTAGNHFFGKVDGALLINRALTPAEITQLYNWRQP